MSNKQRSAIYSINQFANQIDDYSHASKADMRHILHRCVKDLHQLGYKLSHIKGLKPKHIHILVEHLKQQDKNPATIKNYMAKLRKTANRLGKPQLIKPNNDSYNIPKRSYAPSHNKALTNIDLSQCKDKYVRLSIEAQALFGLRREESIKLVLAEAIQGNALVIKPIWSKGGIGRTILITNQAQQQWLEKAAKTIPSHQSLIPKDRTYKTHLSHYHKQLAQLGLSKLHGLRHAYAQTRYRELTGELSADGKSWLSPIQGGPTKQELTTAQKEIDHAARTIISSQIGHSRISITKNYCG